MEAVARRRRVHQSEAAQSEACLLGSWADDDDDDDVDLDFAEVLMMMMMTLGGAVCPVLNETGNTCYKNVAAPKRAVDFEIVA